jgi:hypothetical protein
VKSAQEETARGTSQEEKGYEETRQKKLKFGGIMKRS